MQCIQTVCNFKASICYCNFFGTLSIVGSAMYFLNHHITLWCVIKHTLGLPLCLLISVFAYVKIFLVLRHQQVQIQTRVQNHIHQGQPSQTVPLNIARYRKTVSSALWVQLALVVCYLPYDVVQSKDGYCILFPCQGGNSNFSLLTFIIKPDFLLLEDQRSETGCEENGETTLLFLDLTDNKKHFN